MEMRCGLSDKSERISINVFLVSGLALLITVAVSIVELLLHQLKKTCLSEALILNLGFYMHIYSEKGCSNSSSVDVDATN